jgi:hypothetical protein
MQPQQNVREVAPTLLLLRATEAVIRRQAASLLHEALPGLLMALPPKEGETVRDELCAPQGLAHVK